MPPPSMCPAKKLGCEGCERPNDPVHLPRLEIYDHGRTYRPFAPTFGDLRMFEREFLVGAVISRNEGFEAFRTLAEMRICQAGTREQLIGCGQELIEILQTENYFESLLDSRDTKGRTPSPEEIAKALRRTVREIFFGEATKETLNRESVLEAIARIQREEASY